MEDLHRFPDLSPAEQQAILDGPALTPPQGGSPNLDNPTNRNGTAIAVSVVCLFLLVLSVLIRTYSRLFLVRKWRIEDCMFLKWVLYQHN